MNLRSFGSSFGHCCITGRRRQAISRACFNEALRLRNRGIYSRKIVHQNEGEIRMSRRAFHWLAGGMALLLTAAPLLAHHNITAKFDPAKTRTLNGVVTRLDWANPHVHILMDVVEGNTVTNWAVELESTLDLERSGWNLNTLKSGDAITVQGMTSRDGSPQIWGDSVVVTATGRRVLDVSAAAKAHCYRSLTCLFVRFPGRPTVSPASVRSLDRRDTGDGPAPQC